jgi:hypothetical protein
MLRTNALVVSMMLVGCGTQPKDEFATATPSASALAINVPQAGTTQGASSSALLGDKPGLYTFTRDVSGAVNDGIADILGRIEFITDHPPTRKSGNVEEWGPMSRALDTAEWTLHVEKAADGSYNYVLAGKPKGADDSQYKAVMAGHAIVVNDTHGSGEFLLDFSAIHALDDSHKATGQIAVHYDNTSDPRNVEVAFKDFTDDAGVMPRDALYRYAEHPDRSGNFEFVTLQDIDHDGVTKEVVGILSRWNATGAGRSDAAATGGSLADLTVHVEECWDASFGETYYHDNLDINPTEGDPASCVF